LSRPEDEGAERDKEVIQDYALYPALSPATKTLTSINGRGGVANEQPKALPGTFDDWEEQIRT